MGGSSTASTTIGIIGATNEEYLFLTYRDARRAIVI
jgi:hypothetical protein